MKLIKTIIIVSFCLISLDSFAFSLIKDSEIEGIVQEIALPIAKTAGIKNLKIYLINDDSLNAFTAGGNVIYVNIGIMKQFANLDVIRGVIAHEIGHIKSGHVSRQISNIRDYNKANLIGIGLGIAAMLANQDIGTAIMMASPHMVERSILKHSRDFEFSADRTAMSLLEANGLSVKGLIEFFEYMKKGDTRALVNIYEQTHPLNNERIAIMRGFYQKSRYKESRASAGLEYKFVRSRAKLIGFTSNPKKLLSMKNSGFSGEAEDYLKSVAYFKNSDLKSSLLYINKLLLLRPQDAFYHELHGQILFEFGQKEAIDSYNKAVDLKPEDLSIRLGRAIVLLNIHHASSELALAYDDLQLIITKENDNLVALYYLSIYYEKIDNKAKSLLYLAIIEYKKNNLSQAQKLAKMSLKGLSKDSPDWYKAYDIIHTKS